MTKEKRASEDHPLRNIVTKSLIPLLLLLIAPPAMLVLNYYQLRTRDFQYVLKKGLLPYTLEAIDAVNFWDFKSWSVIMLFSVWSAVIPLCIGGKKFRGPPTSTGYRPAYIDSGFRYFCLTMILFTILIFSSHFPSCWKCYQMFLPLSGSACILGLVVSAFLMLKGSLFPSPGEHSSSGNPIFDFYWGLELYPRIGKYFDFKVWSISRFGMMAWVLVVLVTWKAQFEIYGFNWSMTSSSLSQLVYLGKFYWWDYGYMHTIDITTDHAGFYLVYGCISFLPFFLTSTSIYFVENPNNFGPVISIALFVLCLFLIFLTYWIDCERVAVRNANGQCLVWSKPAKFIKASYIDGKGLKKENILVCSGFWGIVRHPNYVAELLTNFCWMFPCGFTSYVPYLWGIFLAILIVHRSQRDEDKCLAKYGEHWQKYKSIVKYRLLYGIF